MEKASIQQELTCLGIYLGTSKRLLLTTIWDPLQDYQKGKPHVKGGKKKRGQTGND